MYKQQKLEYAKMFWHKVWLEQYSYEGQKERLKTYGLTEEQINEVADLADKMAADWNAEHNRRMREDF